MLQAHRRLNNSRLHSKHTRSAVCTTARAKARDDILHLIKDQSRGLKTDKSQRREILRLVTELAQTQKARNTTGREVNATWRLLWTTEKETLFILKNAGLFGTEAGDVYQVIDIDTEYLQNVITFKNSAAFVVDSSLFNVGDKRLGFQFTGAKLKLPSGKIWHIPPFGKGWFDTVYLDKDLRIAKDIRGDTLIVERAGPPQKIL